MSRRSTIGRPRALTDEQVRLVLQWHGAVLAWKAQRPLTPHQLARHLGVSPSAVYNVIRRGGEYKQRCPTLVRR
jgi:hypothetical protein